jgi:hypothetical protein
MKHPSRAKSHGTTGKQFCGAWERRLAVSLHDKKYCIAKPNLETRHMRDFVWISEYNAWLRSYEQLRKGL